MQIHALMSVHAYRQDDNFLKMKFSLNNEEGSSNNNNNNKHQASEIIHHKRCR